MTTTLANCRIELSKQIADYWASTTTTTGTPATTGLIDTLLMAKQDDWITKQTHTLITKASHAATDDERLVTSLYNDTGTLVTLAHDGTIEAAVTYELHRLFTASEKRQALIAAARFAFPHIHEKIWDESIVSGNWLKDGSFEIWASSTLTHWTVATVTVTETTTSGLYKHGSRSCKLSGTKGNIKQSIANWDDLKRLAGKAVTFTLQGHSDEEDCLRIAIYDGTTYTYSDHHDGDTTWTEDNDPLSVSATIDDNPTAIEFIIYQDVDNKNSYIDDGRVIGPDGNRIYIADLGLAQEKPVQVYIEPSNYSMSEPWILIHNAVVDTENGYLYLPSGVSNDYRLRIIGMGYLDFLVSGASSTTWAAAINIDSPQTDILITQAILYLYTWMSMPNFTAGDRKDFMEMMGYWQQELRKRIAKFGMPIPSAPVKWR